MTRREKIILQFIKDDAASNIDLMWKLNQYLKYGTLDFLGKRKKLLNEKLDKKVSSKISKDVTS